MKRFDRSHSGVATNPGRRRVLRSGAALSGAAFSASALSGIGAAGIAGPAAAQGAWPTKPVSISIGFPPGTATDLTARLLAEGLTRHLGQSFVVENKPGMGGSMAAGLVARAQPDGYSLLVGASAPMSINPHVYSKLTYDPLKDFEPIGLLAWVPMILVVNPSVPANTLQELIALARSKPEYVSYASTGNGTTSHLLMEMIGARSNVRFTHVPYKGSAQAQVDIVGGQVLCTFDSILATLPMVRAGKVKAIAASTLERPKAASEIATMDQQGFPGFDVAAWHGLMAPAGTPAPILDTLSRTLAKVQTETEFRSKIEQGGAEVRGSASRKEFASFITRDFNEWGTVVRQIDLKPS